VAREQDQDRLREQNERRQLLRSKLEQSGDSQGVNVIINEAKEDSEGFIHVYKDIAKRIKPHQIEGVRFLWDQIVLNGGSDGCLLAHTMGLGKTMQT
jgi:SNF2 family DNA or RNA helicase